MDSGLAGELELRRVARRVLNLEMPDHQSPGSWIRRGVVYSSMAEPSIREYDGISAKNI